VPKASKPRSKAASEALKGILTRVNADGLKALRMLALERDMTLQALAIEAFNDVLRKYRRPAIVRNPLSD
jgi:hypothetical protein